MHGITASSFSLSPGNSEMTTADVNKKEEAVKS